VARRAGGRRRGGNRVAMARAGRRGWHVTHAARRTAAPKEVRASRRCMCGAPSFAPPRFASMARTPPNRRSLVAEPGRRRSPLDGWRRRDAKPGEDGAHHSQPTARGAVVGRSLAGRASASPRRMQAGGQHTCTTHGLVSHTRPPSHDAARRSGEAVGFRSANLLAEVIGKARRAPRRRCQRGGLGPPQPAPRASFVTRVLMRNADHANSHGPTTTRQLRLLQQARVA
jgi:hypothetical protein